MNRNGNTCDVYMKIHMLQLIFFNIQLVYREGTHQSPIRLSTPNYVNVIVDDTYIYRIIINNGTFLNKLNVLAPQTTVARLINR